MPRYFHPILLGVFKRQASLCLVSRQSPPVFLHWIHGVILRIQLLPNKRCFKSTPQEIPAIGQPLPPHASLGPGGAVAVDTTFQGLKTCPACPIRNIICCRENHHSNTIISMARLGPHDRWNASGVYSTPNCAFDNGPTE